MINRTLYKTIENRLKVYPVVVITGPRQVGKSTLAYEFVKQGFSYISLDNINNKSFAKADPIQFISMQKLPLIIDEIQYVPELFAVIESIVNEIRLKQGSANGMFILTGSEELKIKKGIESLAGRATRISMYGLSLSEIYQVEEMPFIPTLERAQKRLNNYQLSKSKLFDLIVKGSYPELYNNPLLDKDTFYSDYINTYIERDIMNIIDIKDRLLFHRFMSYLASETGQELNITDISKNIGIRVATVNSWLSVLTETKTIYLLQPYFEKSLLKRIVKRPKLYFSDTGLAAYLAKLSDSENLELNRFAGAFSETFMMNEIMKSYTNNGLEFNAFYYRDNNQNEIDLIMIIKGNLYRIELKNGVTYSKNDTKSFKQLNETSYQLKESAIICLTDIIYVLDQNIFVLPIETI